MKFAIRTVKEIVNGSPDTKVRAMATFGIWLSVGAFMVSTVTFYIAPYSGQAVEIFGGLFVALLVMAAKVV